MSALGQKATSSAHDQCLLHPRKGTLLGCVGMSALCQKRTLLKLFNNSSRSFPDRWSCRQPTTSWKCCSGSPRFCCSLPQHEKGFCVNVIQYAASMSAQSQTDRPDPRRKIEPRTNAPTLVKMSRLVPIRDFGRRTATRNLVITDFREKPGIRVYS